MVLRRGSLVIFVIAFLLRFECGCDDRIDGLQRQLQETSKGDQILISH